MTHFWTRASVVVLAGAALGACTTPQYPLEAGQPRGEPLSVPTPNFPIVQPAAAQPAPGEPAPATAPTATAPVESTALPPPSGTTAPPPAPVASSTLAPLATTTTTVAPAPAPIQMVPTTVTESKTVPIADGRVISVDAKPQSYVVKKGDHIDAIARKLGTTRTQLVKDNDLKKPYRIQPGDTLSGPSRKSKAYVVEGGDTLYAVARRFSVKPATLADENDVSVSAGLRPGQKLILPSGYHDVGAGKRTVTTTRTVMKPAPAPAPTAVQTVIQTQTTPATTTTLAPTTVAATTTTTVTPAPVGAAPATTTTTTTVTPAPKPYTPPATTTAPVAKPYTPAPSPYVPTARPVTPPAPTPAPVSKPYTPSPSPYAPPPMARPYTPSPGVAPMVQSSAPPTDAEIAAAGAGRFVQPVTGAIISDYGPKDGGQRNDGVNFAAPAGTPVLAAAAGEVVYAGDQVPGFGNLVLVKHTGGWVTAYAHMGRVDVKMRDTVSQGQQIGQVGSTGGVLQPQLHFEVRYAPTPQDKARPVDPKLVLPR